MRWIRLAAIATLLAACVSCGEDPPADLDADGDAVSSDTDAGSADEDAPDEGDAEPDVDTPDTADPPPETNDADSDDRDDPPTDETPADLEVDTDEETDPPVETDSPVETDADADIDIPDARPDIWFEIGTGVGTYEPLSDGDEMLITQGIQGGFHVWGGAIGNGFDREEATVEYRLTDADSTLVGAVWADGGFDEHEGGWVLSAVTVFLGMTIIPETLDGRSHRLCGTLFSGDGLELTDCVDIVTVCCDYL